MPALGAPALPLSGASAPAGAPCVAVAVDDFYTIETDGVLGGTVTENDTTCLFPVTLTAGPAHGVLTQLSPRGVFGYTPDPGFAGTDSFTYAIITDLDDATATVTIDVQACVPVAVDDAYFVEAGATLTGNLTETTRRAAAPSTRSPDPLNATATADPTARSPTPRFPGSPARTRSRIGSVVTIRPPWRSSRSTSSALPRRRPRRRHSPHRRPRRHPTRLRLEPGEH